MKNQDSGWDRDSYKTGSTQPPKNKGGTVALLLAAVILLGGISTGLGVMNIHLFRKLQENNAMSFHAASAPEQATQDSVSEPARSGVWLALGVECETVSPIYQRFYDIPGGVLVTDVQENSRAARSGLLQSDIVTACNGETLASVEQLQELLDALPPGQSIELAVYRNRLGQTVTVNISEEEDTP